VSQLVMIKHRCIKQENPAQAGFFYELDKPHFIAATQNQHLYFSTRHHSPLL